MIVLFSIFVFYLNRLYPYFSGDDFIFQLKIPDDGIIGSERIQSLGDLIQSQINFYKNYHYRVINHTVLQVILLFPNWVFDLLNTLILLLFPWVILKSRSDLEKTEYWKWFLAILLYIWCFHFSLGWCYWPVTGALNYTWMLITQLWYIILLLEYRKGIEKNGLLVGLAFLNCMVNENAAVALLLTTLFIAWETRKNKSLTLWICAGIIGLGGLFMLLSPSIGWRMSTQGHREAGLISHLIEYGRRTGYYLLRYSPALILLILAKHRKIKLDGNAKYILFTFLVATGIMVGIPLFEPRSAVFGFFLILLLVVYLMKGEIFPNTVLFFLLGLSLVLAITRTPEFRKQNKRNLINEELLEANRGADEVLLNKYCDNIQRGYLLCHEISEDPKYFDNLTLAAFYTIKEVKLASEEVDINRRHVVFQELRSDPNYITSYKKKLLENGEAIYYKSDGDKLDLLLVSENPEPFFIIRGSRKNYLKHWLSSLIPEKLRLYFLDYLEDTTKRSQESIVIYGKRLCYDVIDNYRSYNYLLISEYSFEDHAPVGKIARLELE